MRAATDLVVVGGGPVGLATAILARAGGFEVVVCDARRAPIDKACGEGLMPDGVDALARMGVVVPAGTGHPFRGIRYLDGGHRAEARFAAGHGLGLRRTTLHRLLVDRAAGLGVELCWERRVTGLAAGGAKGVETSAGPLKSRWVVGADGLASRVRRWAGLEGPEAARRRYGRRRHYSRPPWTDLVEVYWVDGCEAYVTPVAADEIGVAMLWRGGERENRPFEELLEEFPALERRLSGAPVVSGDRGAGPLQRLPRGVRRDAVFLVGDAAGYLDAITGEGLSLGFHQAEALVAALAAERPGDYERAVRRLTAWPFLLVRLLLFAERHPALRRRMVAALSRDGELFARILAVHARQAPPRTLGLGTAARLARGLLAGA